MFRQKNKKRENSYQMEFECTTFYTQAQANEKIDLRDNRGKVYQAALVLVEFVLALFCDRDGTMSSIHRHMAIFHDQVVSFMGIENAPKKAISRAQLPVFLSKIDYEVFAYLVIKNTKIAFKIGEQSWYAIDGKELRGSIEAGSKRGEAIVQIVSHTTREVVGQGYYNGKKESEVPAVKALLEKTGVKKQKVTLDALHLKPNTLKLINKGEGKYLVGLKGNQQKLSEIAKLSSSSLPALYSRTDKDKKRKHGREEQRQYASYDVSKIDFDQRWEEVDFQTLIKVYRKRKVVKTGKQMYEISYYLSNISIKNMQTAYDLFDAVRNHWQVEVNNNIRDTILKEDKLCTSNAE